MRITKDPDLRREDILSAALQLFREEGYDKVSVESITQKAKIAKGSFYNYYKSKEDVYEAVISATASQTLETATSILTEKGATPIERLIRYIDWTFRLTEQEGHRLSRVLEPKASGGQRQMYLRALDEGNKQMFPIFEKLLREGAESGEFEIVNVRFTAVAMLGAFRGIHIAFYDNLQIDMATGRVYLYDFLSRLLKGKFP